MTHEIAGTDPKLAGLEVAIDDGAMRERLAAMLGISRAPELEHRVLKHKLGKHCVVEYRLGERRVYGKVYRGDRGEVVFDNMCRLWTAGDGGARIGMPRPLVYLPEASMMLMGPVPGEPLHLAGPAVDRVARNLAHLHEVDAFNGTSLVRRDAAEQIRRWCRPGPEALIRADPGIAPLVDNVIRAVQAPAVESLPLVPVHGDLGVTQVFVTSDQAYFIDFDGLCYAPAALDVANFLVSLETHFGGGWSRSFLRCYLEHRLRDHLEGLEVYRALVYLRRAMIHFRDADRTQDWRPTVRGLLQSASSCLEVGGVER